MVIFGVDISGLFSIWTVICLLLGSFIGMLLGALPGLGATIAIVMLLPMTYTLDPLYGILLLLSAYQCAEYGGSISSVILGIPGTPSAVATVIDGNAMAKKGMPGKALAYSLTASTIGGLASGLAVIFLAVPLAKAAMKIADPEFCIIALIGLFAAATISAKNFTRSIISLFLGIMISTIGIDYFLGVNRFTFGMFDLMEGVSLPALLVALFAISEVLFMVMEAYKDAVVTDMHSAGLSTKLTWKELWKVKRAITIGSIFGILAGAMPGLGPPSATWFSYATIKKLKVDPTPLGEGNADGIAAPEAANNGAVGGSMIPMLALSIPGTGNMAIIMSAFILHGVYPGPKVFTNNPELVWGVLIGFLLGVVVMYIMGRVLTPVFSRLLLIPTRVLAPVVLVLAFAGVYAADSSIFNVWLSFIVGLFAFWLVKLDYSLPVIILAYVLGPIVEESLRRTLLINNGSYMTFIQRPISCTLLVILLVGICVALFFNIKKSKDNKDVASSSTDE